MCDFTSATPSSSHEPLCECLAPLVALPVILGGSLALTWALESHGGSTRCKGYACGLFLLRGVACRKPAFAGFWEC